MNRIPFRHSPVLRRALILLALLAVGACAPRIELPRHDEAASDLAAFRARFVAPGPQGSGVAVRASLLYSTPSKSNRTDVQLFGDYDRPLRLDVRAGFGTMLALMREDQSGLLAFYPDKSRAYAHSDPIIGAQLLGLPFPFALRDLALVMAGHFGTLVPDEAAAVRAIPGGGFAFSYDKGPVRLLVIDQYGRPERMEGLLSQHFKAQVEREGASVSGPRVWGLAFSGYPEDEGDPVGPAKTLTLTLPKGDSAVLRVRSVATRAEAWSTKSLTLTLPANAEFISLERQAVPAQVRDVITGGGNDERREPGPAAGS
ncbi:MAG: hypothetical protein Q8O35_01660 [Humidesulfovibrio sp.]|uniref:hypothetical protein n=1 Tax=Humidesulfovibrio sp. TaxID=2910988 RepID=UPI0027352C66|nr:hypothetical protein [Humidesulfovibrio sp.]MDP2846879.1 hypothetical protein [Humidesulfovibrio sp.]